MNWISLESKRPPDETPVLIVLGGVIRIGEIRWEEPTYEDTYKRFQYWDDPNDDGQCWEWQDISHWMPFPEPPEESKMSDSMTPEQICECGHPKMNHVISGTGPCDCGCPCGQFEQQLRAGETATRTITDKDGNVLAYDRDGFAAPEMAGETAVPDDLYRRTAGHGDEAGCECDLGFDPECTIQPPYEHMHEYCERLRERIGKNEAEIRELREQSSLTSFHATHVQLSDNYDRMKQRAEAAEAALNDMSINRKLDEDSFRNALQIAEAEVERLKRMLSSYDGTRAENTALRAKLASKTEVCDNAKILLSELAKEIERLNRINLEVVKDKVSYIHANAILESDRDTARKAENDLHAKLTTAREIAAKYRERDAVCCEESPAQMCPKGKKYQSVRCDICNEYDAALAATGGERPI